MDQTSGVVIRRISNNEPVDYIFTDMGLINGAFVSKLKIDGKEYISITGPNPGRNAIKRFEDDKENFKKYGFLFPENS